MTDSSTVRNESVVVIVGERDEYDPGTTYSWTKKYSPEPQPYRYSGYSWCKISILWITEHLLKKNYFCKISSYHLSFEPVSDRKCESKFSRRSKNKSDVSEP